MKRALQGITDIFWLVVAVGVFGIFYFRTQPDHANAMIKRASGLLNPSIWLPSIGALDVLLLVVMAIGLVSTVVIFAKRKTLLRGPTKVVLIR